MRSPHAPGFVAVCKCPLNQLPALAQQTFALWPLQAPPIFIDRLLLFLFAHPVPLPRLLLLWDIGAHTRSFGRRQHGATVVPLVGHQFLDATQIHLGLLPRRRPGFSRDQVGYGFPCLCQGFLHRGGISQVRPLQRHRDNRSGFHVHGMLGFVGQVGAAVLHLGDARIRIIPIDPLLVRPFLLPLAIHSRQVFPCRRGDAGLLGQPFEKLLVALSVVSPHDRAHRRVGLQRGRVNADLLALHQSRVRQQSQDPRKDFPMGFHIHQAPGPRNRGMVRGTLFQRDPYEGPDG